MLVTETPPPPVFGRADYTYLMFQAAKLPEAKVKPIFDAAQWRLLSRQFNNAQMMEQWLRQNQLIAGGVKGAANNAVAIQPAAALVPAALAVKAAVRKGAARNQD